MGKPHYKWAIFHGYVSLPEGNIYEAYFGPAPHRSDQVVDLPLPQLAPFDAARLLARRARRPFFAADFEGGNSLPTVPLSMGRELLLRLRESPVMKEVKGAGDWGFRWI